MRSSSPIVFEPHILCESGLTGDKVSSKIPNLFDEEIGDKGGVGRKNDAAKMQILQTVAALENFSRVFNAKLEYNITK